MIHSFRPYFDRHEVWAVLLGSGGRAEFERAVAERVGASYGVAFSYGRSAIIAILKALDLNSAEVVLPAYTCKVVAEGVVVSGNLPVFVDIDLSDYNMDIVEMERALSHRTRAIVATDMYGYPADIAAIRAMVGDERVVIIEDAAHLGPVPLAGEAERRADVTVFSFSPGKQLYSIAGGVAVTDRGDLYEKIKTFRDREMNRIPRKALAKRVGRLVTGYMMLNAQLFEGWKKINETNIAARARDTLDLTSTAMPSDYEAALTDFQGRLGLAQLRKFDCVRFRSGVLGEFYDRQLGDTPGITLPPARSGVVRAPYTILVERRDEVRFCQRMLAQGVEVGTSFDYVLPQMEPYRRFAKGSYPRAGRVAREVVNVPSYASLSAKSARHIAESMRRILAVPVLGWAR
ncbi:MAG: DegT/DnrJ/EryC1/StrS family aminotransferase [Chloroflexi bacterium]|nr:DegT/DnrJ/EryC1/StrS family aminotransferase [Chloroflexota bacterium]